MSAGPQPPRPPVYMHRGDGGHDWYYAVVDGFLEAFRALGYAAHALGTRGPERDRFIADLNRGTPVWTIDLNGRMRIPPGFDMVRKFTILVDHPFLRVEDLAAARAGDVIGVCDESHLAAMTAVRADLTTLFLPHAGPVPGAAKPFDARTIPLLYAGSLPATAGTETWRAENPAVPEPAATAVIEAAESMAVDAVPVLTALQQGFARHDTDLFTAFTPQTLIGLVEQTERLAEWISRSALLLALTDLPLHLVAPGLPDYLTPLPAGWTFHGECSAAALNALMADTRIVLNPIVKFPHGAHDRVFNAQAQGAAAATPYSHFLARDYVDGESILFIDPVRDPAGTARSLGGLLDGGAGLERLASAGRTVYADRHTWSQRAQRIAAALTENAPGTAL